MPELREIFARLHGVVIEHRLAVLAVEQLRSAVRDGHLHLPPRTDPGDVVRTADRLQPTYLIRLWAEFESAMLSYRRYRSGDPAERMPATNLVEWTAALRQGRTVSVAFRESVHEVRRYRNALVHEHDDPAPPVEVETARSRLNTLLAAKLPERW
jgi:hypothetical protein